MIYIARSTQARLFTNGMVVIKMHGEVSVFICSWIP